MSLSWRLDHRGPWLSEQSCSRIGPNYCFAIARCPSKLICGSLKPDVRIFGHGGIRQRSIKMSERRTRPVCFCFLLFFFVLFFLFHCWGRGSASQIPSRGPVLGFNKLLFTLQMFCSMNLAHKLESICQALSAFRNKDSACSENEFLITLPKMTLQLQSDVCICNTNSLQNN